MVPALVTGPWLAVTALRWTHGEAQHRSGRIKYIRTTNQNRIIMRISFSLLRSIGFFLLCLSTSLAEAKECTGSIFVLLKHADGSYVGVTADDEAPYIQTWTMTLSAGDTIMFWQMVTGECWGIPYGIHVRGTALGDTADWTSPVVNAAEGSGRIAQRGSYYVEQYGVDWGSPIRLFIDAPQEPLPVGLLFTKPDNYDLSPFILGSIAAGDTCGGPCFNAYLNDDQSVRMQPIHGGLAQAGGKVVVRYAADGDPISFDTPSDTVVMLGFEGYQFSTDGTYLLSVEGPFITATGFAYVHVSHGNIPYINVQVAKKGSDGMMYSLTTASAIGPVAFVDLELALGDSIMFRYNLDQAPCTGIRLKAFRSDGDTATTQDPLFLDHPLDVQWFKFRAFGALLLTLEDTCGAVTASAHVSVSEALATGITNASDAGFRVFHANDLLRVVTDSGGLLEIRNVAGQLVREAQVVQGAQHLALPFTGHASGVYIATLRSDSQVEVMRFVVY